MTADKTKRESQSDNQIRASQLAWPASSPRGDRGGVGAQDARAAVITIRTRSAAFFAPSFFMMLARWSSMVRGLIPKCRPASLLEEPAVNCSSKIGRAHV